ncbi:hypothetical protein HYQ46_007599 [Verticillium longisporum]|nr:hypothetical protein HYQ46_007599 [Verticillium longisporum]
MRGAAFCKSASSELESEVAWAVGSTPTYEVSVTRVMPPSASVEVRVVTTALDDVVLTPGKASASRREVFLNRLTLLDLCVDVRLHQAVKRLGLCRLDGLGDLLRQLHLRLGKRRLTSGSAVGMVSSSVVAETEDEPKKVG